MAQHPEKSSEVPQKQQDIESGEMKQLSDN